MWSSAIIGAEERWYTQTAWEWGHWRPYPEDEQRSWADKRKKEQKERFHVTPLTDDTSRRLEAVYNKHKMLTNTDKSAVNATSNLSYGKMGEQL